MTSLNARSRLLACTSLIMLPTFGVPIGTDGLLTPNPSVLEISAALTEMLVARAALTKPRVTQVLRAGPLVAVILDPPYREFPNVIFFAVDRDSGRWKRQYEVLSLGLVDYRGPLLDLHTDERIGAFDLTVSRGDSGGVSAEPVESTFESIAGKEKMVTVLYSDFVHMHGPVRSLYMIDKRRYTAIGSSEVDPRYETDYKGHGCMMYDTPLIKNATFKVTSRDFQLTARAPLRDGSIQTWLVTFSGFSAGRIADKVIRVYTVQ